MAAIRIPVRLRGPLSYVASMSSERFEALSNCFRLLEGDILTSQVRSEVGSTIDDPDEGDLLVDALTNAWMFGKDADLTQEGAAKIVASSELLELSESERRVLSGRLATLFHEPVLDLLAHATSVRAEDEHSYCTSRILSDLRPMFGRDKDATPIAALIRHSLKFEVHVDDRIESIVLAVNDIALREIAANIERALNKADSLRKIAHSANIRVVDSGEVH